MSFSFLTPEFLGLAVVAILLVAGLDGPFRQIAFCSVNILFLWMLLLGPSGTVSTIAFCVLGFVLTHFILRFPRSSIFSYSLIGIIVLFAYMQKYDFLHWFLAEDLLTNVLRTIGLSFLFFKIIHVFIEARSGTLGSLQFSTYVNYCLNFTTFMMGPIQRYQDYAAQWNRTRLALEPDLEGHIDAVLRVLVGLVKAYVLASWFESKALRPDTDIFSLSLLGLLVQVYAFYFYLYLNFSGYCDVAIGIGSLLGVRPPENFNFPFIAQNISEFWLRQHRSLTLWLTDYVFAPLYKAIMGRAWWSAHPLLAANVALMATMLVSGLWHGTTINFFLFGIAHGMFLVIYRTWDALVTKWLGKATVKAWRAKWVVQVSGMFLTFNATAFAFILFRLKTFSF